ncbi:MAG: DoxX family membrane protein [Chthoniobacterales bacterium]|nr:DoxX family membrane protein [Chthoniobacterales bacterium]
MRADAPGQARGLSRAPLRPRSRAAARFALAALFAAAGVNHFAAPEPYVAIVPPALPWREALVYISGAAEIAGALGILFRRTRRPAAAGLIALLAAVFPANIYAALHGMQLGGWHVPEWLLWARLPLQAVLIAWVYIACWRAD